MTQCFQVFWAIGACFEVLLALIVMPTLGWQWLLGFSAIPLLIFAICCVVSFSLLCFTTFVFRPSHPHWSSSSSSFPAFLDCPETSSSMVLMKLVVCSRSSLDPQSFFFCQRGSLRPALCPCFLVQGAGVQNLVCGFVGLSHEGSQLCLTG